MQYLFAILVLVALVACAFAQWPYYGGYYGGAHTYNYAYPSAYNYGYNTGLNYWWKK